MNDPNLYAQGPVSIDEENKIVTIMSGPITVNQLYSMIQAIRETVDYMKYPDPVLMPVDRHLYLLQFDWKIQGLEYLVDKPVIRYPAIEHMDGTPIWTATIPYKQWYLERMEF